MVLHHSYLTDSALDHVTRLAGKTVNELHSTIQIGFPGIPRRQELRTEIKFALD